MTWGSSQVLTERVFVPEKTEKDVKILTTPWPLATSKPNKIKQQTNKSKFKSLQ